MAGGGRHEDAVLETVGFTWTTLSRERSGRTSAFWKLSSAMAHGKQAVVLPGLSQIRQSCAHKRWDQTGVSRKKKQTFMSLMKLDGDECSFSTT